MADNEGEKPAEVDDVVGGTVDDIQKGCFGSLLLLSFLIGSLILVIYLVW